MNDKENLLEAIRFGHPHHVPLGNEPVRYIFAFEGNLKWETWTDHWGVGWEVGIEGTVPFPKRNPLPSLDVLDDFRFPSPGDLVFTDELAGQLRSIDRSGTVVIGALYYLLFERAWAVMGMENFMTGLMTHPEEMHVFLHRIAHYARDVFDRYLELGVDGINFSEDLGTQRALFMSPDTFREFILPEYKYIFANVLTEGKIVWFHSCGCVEDIVGDLADIGVTVLNPVQARANDLRKIKDIVRGRMALDGAIDTAVLATGNPDDVRREVGRVMAILKPDAGYVCSPDQGIPGIPQENMDALWETAREIGLY
jgi:uroporphyrinogen decarboxylase